MSPLVIKLLYIVLFYEDITQLEQKKSSHWYKCCIAGCGADCVQAGGSSLFLGHNL